MRRSSISVAVSVTRCIVTCPPLFPRDLAAGSLVALAVPANEQLVGTQFAYFPQLEGTKEIGAQPSWGGADIGSHLFYPAQVVDGIVARLGGKELREVCAALPVVDDYGTRCPVGRAVVTNAPSQLGEHFDKIVHVVPPMWQKHGSSGCGKSLGVREKENEDKLLEAYDSLFECVLRLPPSSTMLCPLLGCGARGAPVNVSITAAVRSVLALTKAASALPAGDRIVHFGIQNPQLAESLEAELAKVGLMSG